MCLSIFNKDDEDTVIIKKFIKYVKNEECYSESKIYELMPSNLVTKHYKGLPPIIHFIKNCKKHQPNRVMNNIIKYLLSQELVNNIYKGSTILLWLLCIKEEIFSHYYNEEYSDIIKSAIPTDQNLLLTTYLKDTAILHYLDSVKRPDLEVLKLLAPNDDVLRKTRKFGMTPLIKYVFEKNNFGVDRDVLIFLCGSKDSGIPDLKYCNYTFPVTLLAMNSDFRDEEIYKMLLPSKDLYLELVDSMPKGCFTVHNRIFKLLEFTEEQLNTVYRGNVVLSLFIDKFYDINSSNEMLSSLLPTDRSLIDSLSLFTLYVSACKKRSRTPSNEILKHLKPSVEYFNNFDNFKNFIEIANEYVFDYSPLNSKHALSPKLLVWFVSKYFEYDVDKNTNHWKIFISLKNKKVLDTFVDGKLPIQHYLKNSKKLHDKIIEKMMPSSLDIFDTEKRLLLIKYLKSTEGAPHESTLKMFMPDKKFCDIKYNGYIPLEWIARNDKNKLAMKDVSILIELLPSSDYLNNWYNGKKLNHILNNAYGKGFLDSILIKINSKKYKVLYIILSQRYKELYENTYDTDLLIDGKILLEYYIIKAGRNIDVNIMKLLIPKHVKNASTALQCLLKNVPKDLITCEMVELLATDYRVCSTLKGCNKDIIISLLHKHPKPVEFYLSKVISEKIELSLEVIKSLKIEESALLYYMNNFKDNEYDNSIIKLLYHENNIKKEVFLNLYIQKCTDIEILKMFYIKNKSTESLLDKYLSYNVDKYKEDIIMFLSE